MDNIWDILNEIIVLYGPFICTPESVAWPPGVERHFPDAITMKQAEKLIIGIKFQSREDV